MVQSADYEDLLWVASHKLSDTFMLTNLSLDSLWRCLLISKHQLGTHIHKQNVEQLRRVLRRKGFTLTPDSEMVSKVPSGTQYSRYDIVSVLRRALLVSYIPQRACDHALSTVRVVKLAEITLGKKPITTKHWITDLYTGSLPCTCDRYPELHSQKRHGHIFIPSRQYSGFGSNAVQAPMQSELASSIKAGSIASAVRASWRQSLPDFYIPPMFDPDTPQQAHKSDGHFSIDFVNRIVTYLSMMVVMGIDKCTSRCLIMCPQLFKRYFDETFPVERDPVHFTPLPSTFLRELSEASIWLTRSTS